MPAEPVSDRDLSWLSAHSVQGDCRYADLCVPFSLEVDGAILAGASDGKAFVGVDAENALPPLEENLSSPLLAALQRRDVHAIDLLATTRGALRRWCGFSPDSRCSSCQDSGDRPCRQCSGSGSGDRECSHCDTEHECVCPRCEGLGTEKCSCRKIPYTGTGWVRRVLVSLELLGRSLPPELGGADDGVIVDPVEHQRVVVYGPGWTVVVLAMNAGGASPGDRGATVFPRGGLS